MTEPKPDSIIVAVFGSSSILQDSENAQEAYQAGKLLAEAGFTVCNGGYMGTMEACSRGVKEAGGRVIGVTCRTFSHRTPNSYLTSEVCSDDLPDRISTLMRLANAFIVLDGNIGTMAELFLAWNLIFLGDPRPLIVVGEDMRQALYALSKRTEISDKQMEKLIFAPTVEEAVKVLVETFR